VNDLVEPVSLGADQSHAPDSVCLGSSANTHMRLPKSSVYASVIFVSMQPTLLAFRKIGVKGNPNGVLFPWLCCRGGSSGIFCFFLLSLLLGLAAVPPRLIPWTKTTCRYILRTTRRDSFLVKGDQNHMSLHTATHPPRLIPYKGRPTPHVATYRDPAAATHSL